MFKPPQFQSTHPAGGFRYDLYCRPSLNICFTFTFSTTTGWKRVLRLLYSLNFQEDKRGSSFPCPVVPVSRSCCAHKEVYWLSSTHQVMKVVPSSSLRKFLKVFWHVWNFNPTHGKGGKLPTSVCILLETKFQSHFCGGTHSSLDDDKISSHLQSTPVGGFTLLLCWLFRSYLLATNSACGGAGLHLALSTMTLVNPHTVRAVAVMPVCTFQSTRGGFLLSTVGMRFINNPHTGGATTLWCCLTNQKGWRLALSSTSSLRLYHLHLPPLLASLLFQSHTP